MLGKIEEVKKAIGAFQIENQQKLEEFRLAFLAKKGVITDLMAGLKEAAPDQRKAIGQALNDLKNFAWEKFDGIQSTMVSAS
ncbi:MAG TPA: phenylalanine--tRNA ligase subunit alpha, partial [Catalimonadaceae bacterium]|nr:phenylalanine--tRNA ligase subunit alpha [Catalimonadaceae bacterium]